MKFVGVIPARGGSKSIPNKNLALCAGRSLLAYTAEAALAARMTRVILSTDSPKIAATGRELGLEVPFLRPPELASDDSSMLDVLQHLQIWLVNSGASPDALVLLQPTSPLRQARHILEAIELFEKSSASTLVSVTPVPHQFTPSSVMELDHGQLSPWLKNEAQILRRQDKSKLYARNGPAILIVRSDAIAAGQLYAEPICGYVMTANNSIDVDDVDDLILAEALLKAQKEKREAERC